MEMNENGVILEGFRMTELGPLPREWEVARLGDKNYFQLLKSGIEHFSGSKDYLSTSSIEGLNIIDIEQKITFNFRPSRANMQPILNSVWFARMINTKKIYAFSKENADEINRYILSTGFCGVKINGKIDPSFLKYYFFTDIFDIVKNSLCSGAVQISLGNTNAEKLIIPIPPLLEQQKIAAIVSAVQEAKEKTEAVINATRDLKKSMMNYLFTYGPVPVVDAENVPLKETEIGMIPEEWEVVKFSKIGKFQYGYTESGSAINIGPKFLRITDIDLTSGNINWSSVPYCKISDVDYPKYELYEGDVLVARIGATTGKTCIIKKPPPKSVFASYLIRFIHYKEKVDPFFVYYFTNSNKYWAQVNASKEGKLKKGVSSSQLKNFRASLPPLPTQQKIASILSAIDEKIEAEENKKRALEDLFNTLLHNLMTARIRVNHLEVEI